MTFIEQAGHIQLIFQKWKKPAVHPLSPQKTSESTDNPSGHLASVAAPGALITHVHILFTSPRNKAGVSHYPQSTLSSI